MIRSTVFATSLSAGLLCAASPLLAQEFTETRGNIGGSVDAFCRMGAVTAAGSGATVTGGGSETLVSLGSIVDPDTATATPIQVQLDVQTSCNFNHRIAMRSTRGGLTLVDAAPPSPGFARRVDYRMAVNAGTAAAQLDTAGQPVGLELLVPGALSGAFIVSISSPGGGLPLVAGEYRDDIEIQFTSGL